MKRLRPMAPVGLIPVLGLAASIAITLAYAASGRHTRLRVGLLASFVVAASHFRGERPLRDSDEFVV